MTITPVGAAAAAPSAPVAAPTATDQKARLTAYVTPSTIYEGSFSTLWLSLDPPPQGSGKLTGLGYTVAVPDGLTLDSATDIDCGAQVTPARDGRSFTVTGARLPTPNPACDVSVMLTADAPGRYVFPRSAVTDLTGVVNELPEAGVTLTARPTATLTAEFTPTTLAAGVPGTLTVAVARTREIDTTLPEFQFSLLLPDGLTVPDHTVEANTCLGKAEVNYVDPLLTGFLGQSGEESVNLTGGNLIEGQSRCTVTVRVVAAKTGEYPLASTHLLSFTSLRNGLPHTTEPPPLGGAHPHSSKTPPQPRTAEKSATKSATEEPTTEKSTSEPPTTGKSSAGKSSSDKPTVRTPTPEDDTP